MDEYQVQTQFDDHSFAFEEESPERCEQGKFASVYEIDTTDNVEENVETKPRLDHRDSSAGKLFVGGVSWETTEETFANYFSKYGEIRDSVIMLDKHSGRPRGFGFVTFADPATVEKVLREEHIIDGRVVEVKRTVPREEMDVKLLPKTKKIFVGGIPTSLTEGEFKDYFASYGGIVEHQIMMDRTTGRSRGFGFVTFDSEAAVEKVFLDGRTHEIGGKQVEIKKAEPKRAGADYSGSTRAHGSFGSGSNGNGYNSRNRSSGRTGKGYAESGLYGGYGCYGGNYCGDPSAFYGGYGGYGYGFGFNAPIYGNVGFVGGMYAPGACGYPGATGFDVKGYGNRVGNGASNGSGKGYENGGAASERFHPYQR